MLTALVFLSDAEEIPQQTLKLPSEQWFNAVILAK